MRESREMSFIRTFLLENLFPDLLLPLRYMSIFHNTLRSLKLILDLPIPIDITRERERNGLSNVFTRLPFLV